MISLDGDLVFREVQRFRQRWLWLVVILLAGFAWYTAIYQLFLGKPFGDHTAPDILLIVIWLLFGFGLPLLFISSRLVIEVRGDALYYRFYPFHRSFHSIAYDRIKNCEARTYRPLREYGGWGIRWGPGGKAYNVSGDRGVQLELASGKNLLFGSQRPDELAAAIDKAFKKRGEREN